MKLIDTEQSSKRYRSASLDLGGRRLLITNFRGTHQEDDLSEPANCAGFGRIRHFRRNTSKGWPSNPLPIDPASKALGLGGVDMIRAQAFQNAACNWRCWYCYVPFSLLAANPKYSDWLSASQIIDLYLAEPDRPAVIDMSGGQPDLTPEWVPWMMKEVCARGLDGEVYLWSDDNLSTDYFWRFLSYEDIELVANYRNYGRVGCFKGFDAASFSLNTRATLDLFDAQFLLMRRLIETGIDMYAYATFTALPDGNIPAHMRKFVDSLQAIHPNLPLRTVPLEIQTFFAPVKSRHIRDTEAVLEGQRQAIDAWQEELHRRFSDSERVTRICDVRLD